MGRQHHERREQCQEPRAGRQMLPGLTAYMQMIAIFCPSTLCELAVSTMSTVAVYEQNRPAQNVNVTNTCGQMAPDSSVPRGYSSPRNDQSKRSDLELAKSTARAYDQIEGYKFHSGDSDACDRV